MGPRRLPRPGWSRPARAATVRTHPRWSPRCRQCGSCPWRLHERPGRRTGFVERWAVTSWSASAASSRARGVEESTKTSFGSEGSSKRLTQIQGHAVAARREVGVQAFQDAARLRGERAADLPGRQGSQCRRAKQMSRSGPPCRHLHTQPAPTSPRPEAGQPAPTNECLTSSNARTLLMAAVEITTSSCTGTLPPTSPVLPPCRQARVEAEGRRSTGGSGEAGSSEAWRGGQPGQRWLPRWRAQAGVDHAEAARGGRAHSSTPGCCRRSRPAAAARLGHDRQAARVAVPQQRGRLLGGAGLEGHPRRALVLAHPVPVRQGSAGSGTKRRRRHGGKGGGGRESDRAPCGGSYSVCLLPMLAPDQRCCCLPPRLVQCPSAPPGLAC